MSILFGMLFTTNVTGWMLVMVKMPNSIPMHMHFNCSSYVVCWRKCIELVMLSWVVLQCFRMFWNVPLHFYAYERILLNYMKFEKKNDIVLKMKLKSYLNDIIKTNRSFTFWCLLNCSIQLFFFIFMYKIYLHCVVLHNYSSLQVVKTPSQSPGKVKSSTSVGKAVRLW